MQVILPAIVAVLGTLLGVALTNALQRRAADRANVIATSEKRRDEFAQAVGTFASTSMLLRRAEYDRTKRRLSRLENQEREEARQETYRLRTEARSAYYIVRLFANLDHDSGLLQDAERALAMARMPGDAATLGELEETSGQTSQAIDRVVDAANDRLRGWTLQQ